MLNEIYRILSISPCCLLTISKMMHVALKLVEAYLVSEVEDFKNGAINELRIVKEFLEDMNSSCRMQWLDNYPEGVYLRDTIANYIQMINKVVTYTYPDPLEIYKIVNTGGSLFEVIADSNFQLVLAKWPQIFNNSTRLSQFIVESLLANSFYDDNRQPVTYLTLEKQRLPASVVQLPN